MALLVNQSESLAFANRDEHILCVHTHEAVFESAIPSKDCLKCG